MTLLNEILDWTKIDLPAWQRDAARRLFQNAAGLTTADFDELYLMMKAANGLVDPAAKSPVPLDATHLPAASASGNAVTLTRVRELKHVNRIAQKQQLKFSPSGMTVIYGGNGAGKSGYARVLKQACRARNQLEKVLPDASDPKAQSAIPEAIFDLVIGGAPSAVKWIGSSAGPSELSTIAVFDSHCARTYLTSELDVAYLPYGLDVVENLANKVLPELSRRLEVDMATLSVDRSPFSHLEGDTAVGKLMTGLSDKTKLKDIIDLATLSSTEVSRVAELERALKESDPTAKAKDFRLSAGRIKAIAKNIESATSWVSDAAIGKLNGLDDAYVQALKAEKSAAEAFRAGEDLLPGTGDPVWKALFEAARKFSNEVAYPVHSFPHTADDAVCPLCQNPLQAAAARLDRFEKYLKDNVAQEVAKQSGLINSAKTKIDRADLTISLNDSMREELALLDSSIGPDVDAIQNAILTRREWMIKSLQTHDWQSVPAFTLNPWQKIRDLAARQLRYYRTLTKAADEKKNKSLKTEQKELAGREALSKSLAAITALVERMKLKASLESCKKSLKTRPISDKSKELASKAVTSTLKTALDTEFKALGIEHVSTTLKDRNDKGKIKHRLVLNLPTTIKIEDILSEGEQRAIALGSFLAELKMSGHTGGIIFDDPVSSLDHWRRENVAKRLVAEAAHRQVVVFTHETSFLGQLRDELEAKKRPHSIQFLEWKGSRPGHVSDGLPWGHQSYNERIHALEQAQHSLEKKPWPAYPNEDECAEMKRQYNHFRAAIERVIQDVVFNGVVRRYRDWIRVDGLAQVVGFEDAEYQEIARLHQKCNELVDAHDPSSAKNTTVPTATELGADLDALRKLIEKIQDRRKKSKIATPAPQGGASP